MAFLTTQITFTLSFCFCSSFFFFFIQNFLSFLYLVWYGRFRGLLGLKKLRVLDLSRNDINSSQLLCVCILIIIKACGLKYLSKLEVLNQERNSLMGGIPSIIGTLSYLKSLSLGYNNLNGSSSMEGLCKLNLEELDLSLPACLNNLTSLHLLDLSANDFWGTILSSFFSNLKSLEYISLSYNHFEGSIYFGSLFNHFRLEVFELSSNNKFLKVKIENPTGSFPLFQLKILRLSNCTLNWPSQVVPNFLLSQYDLRVVDFGYNNMIGEVPTWLLANNTKLEYLSFESNNLTGVLDLGSSSIPTCLPPFIGSIFPRLVVLYLFGNALQGNIPSSMGDMEQLGSLDFLHDTLSKKSNLTWLFALYLDNNNLWGEISRGFFNSSYLILLDISSDSLMGQIPDWIGDFLDLSTLIFSRNYLDALGTRILSRNYLDGGVLTRFCKLNELHFLDLSHNKISTTLPPCANLTNMKFLHLESNEITRPTPHVLAEATSLVTLNLRDNKLSSPIPLWISLLSKLRVLLLKGNQLEDSIPLHLCQLKSISILDLSHNHLSESIPPCLDNDFWKRKIEFITKSRYKSYMGNILYFMSGLDLSMNKLTSVIPPKIGNLSGIHTLNLSYNQLIGSIPQTFSNLKEIESLDLSHNGLTDHILAQMVELNFLTVFIVAHNNLSGKTPKRKFQFATFEQISYEGNPLLCGLPLERSWTPTSAPLAVKPTVSNNRENSSWKAIFLWGYFSLLELLLPRCSFISLKRVSLFFS
ncbi:hypothetical protein PVL29_004716 [Vitis rotundifolia]|uniref:Uncharacterized protein n=1 Tax=Vitis rotundifolia TaxID=103349 RepID=A0AA39DYQ9_VITRO|nr:hypothetical protein PVL29_004716 [Vitis rotundifolia]